MTNFRKWFKGEYPGGHTSGYYFAHKAWQYRQQEIDQLKAQLNNMEACYIGKKKECEGRQKRIDEVLQEVKGLERFTGEDCIADFDVLQGAVSHACKRLEKTLRGES